MGQSRCSHPFFILYVSPDSISPGYTVKAGENTGLDIDINRITQGENKENRLLGGTGPYWIKMNPGLLPLAGGG